MGRPQCKGISGLSQKMLNKRQIPIWAGPQEMSNTIEKKSNGVPKMSISGPSENVKKSNSEMLLTFSGRFDMFWTFAGGPMLEPPKDPFYTLGIFPVGPFGTPLGRPLDIF